jgi:hypothetical protein
VIAHGLLVYLLVVGMAIGQIGGGKATQDAARADMSDLSSSILLSELRARGVDPLSASGSADLRDTFVDFDFRTGGGRNLMLTDDGLLKSAKNLSTALANMPERCLVRIRTPSPGARIKFRLISRDLYQTFPQLTNATEDSLPLGFYHIWAERNEVRTSSNTIIFRVVKADLTIDLEEASVTRP